jgi:protein-glutamine gamma-glutamyltransferase
MSRVEISYSDPQVVDESSTMEAATIAGQKIVGRLKLYFAILASLGGAILAAGTDTQILPSIAIFFSVFGYLFVDRMRLFALPPLAGYALMAIVAFLCISEFRDFERGGDHQMMAVAQLLVWVQSILMLQEKTRRIFEQLVVFCLLELIVAAVFNNSLSFGLLLIPIALVAALAATLLATLHATDGVTPRSLVDGENFEQVIRPRSKEFRVVSIGSATSLGSLDAAHRRLPRLTAMALAPAVFLIGGVFFYALPRTKSVEANSGSGDNSVIGFSEELSLGQITQMNSNPRIALRIRLKDAKTNEPYRSRSELFLRGKVLEIYDSNVAQGGRAGSWRAEKAPLENQKHPLPRPFISEKKDDRVEFDSVVVQVTAESSRTASLFAIAPYFATEPSSQLRHLPNRNTISAEGSNQYLYPRINYEFGTHAMRAGEQSPWIFDSPLAVPSDKNFEDEGVSEARERFRAAEFKRLTESYMELLTQFDRENMPTIEAIASRLRRSERGSATDYDFAKAAEAHFSSSGIYSYTLKLDSPRVKGMDPIEQFVSKDRKGHCQFFAASLAMVLRSEGIPTRLVVGYATDEYNQLSGQYIARGSHAHAWVEALIERDEIPESIKIYGQPEAQRYWLRLDPTPASRNELSSRSSGTRQVLDIAQNLWDDYGVGMDGSRQSEVLFAGGPSPIHGAYDRFVERLYLLINRVRAGELGGGSLADRGLIGLAAILVIGGSMAAWVLFRIFRVLRPRSRGQEMEQMAAQLPRLEFYLETFRELGRLGMHRSTQQTPAEFTRQATENWSFTNSPSIDGPLAILTRTYYRLRFGKQAAQDPSVTTPEIQQAVDSVKQSVAMAVQESQSTSPSTS